MKKLVAIGLLALTISSSSFAQQKKDPKTSEEKAIHRTEKLTKELSLTPDQATKVKALLLQQDEQVQTIKTKHANDTDKTALKQELLTKREQNEASLKQILTPEQVTQYETLKAQKKEEHKNKGHHKGGKKHVNK